MEQQVRNNQHRNRRDSMRKLPRGTVKVECRKGCTGLGANIAVSFLDMSEGGVRLILKAPLGVKDEVEVVITNLSMSKPVKRLANVMWIVVLENNQFCAGLSFQKRLPFANIQQLAKP